MRWHSIWGLVLVVSVSARAEDYRRRALIVLDNPARAAAVRAHLPRGLRVFAVQGNLLSVVSEGPALSPRDLAALGKLRGVRSVIRAEPARLLEQAAVHGEATNAPAGSGRSACSLTELCPHDGKEKLWGQRRVNADLMQAEIKRLGLERGDAPTPVAIVDSGFNPAHQADMANPVKVRPGWDAESQTLIGGIDTKPNLATVVGDLRLDESGHGTFVAGLIGAKNGVGVAPHAQITMYRATASKDDEGKGTSTDLLFMALKRACDENRDPDGVTVINLSWGTKRDESARSREEKDPAYQAYLRDLANQGCLVVKAAGNSNFRLSDDTVDGTRIDDPYLRVAATDISNSLGFFSSSGEVAAPGEDVYSQQTTDAKFEAKYGEYCGNEERVPGPGGRLKQPTHKFGTGTSYAAPIAAGILSELVRVLKAPGPNGQRGSFARLSPPNRLALVNRIASASMRNGNLDGVRAVNIAARWLRSASSTVPTVAELRQSLEKSPAEICAAPVTDCLQAGECARTRDCYDEGRRRLSLCADPAGAQALQLLRAAAEYQDLESAVAHLGVFRAAGGPIAEGASTVEGLAQQLFTRYHLGDWSRPDVNAATHWVNFAANVDITVMMQVLPAYLEIAKNNKNSLSKTRVELLLRGLLASQDLRDYLSRDPHTRGSEEILAFVAESLAQAKDILGETAVAGLVHSFVDQAIGVRLTGSSKEALDQLIKPKFVTEARVLDALQKRPEFAASVPLLQEDERKMLHLLDGGNLYFADEPDSGGHLFERFYTRPYLQPMLERNRAEILAEVAGSPDLTRLGSIKIDYLLANLESVFAQSADRESFAFKVLEAIAAGKGWGRENDRVMFKRALDRLETLADQGGPEAAARIKLRYRAALAGSHNYDLLAYLMNQVAETTMQVRQSAIDTFVNPQKGWLTTDDTTQLARRMGSGILNQTSIDTYWNTAFQTDLAIDVVQTLTHDRKHPSAPLAGRVTVLQRNLEEMSRVNPPTEKSYVERADLPEPGAVVENLLSWALRAYRDKTPGIVDSTRGRGDARYVPTTTREAGRNVLERIVNYPDFEKMLSSDGPWRALAQDVVDRSKSEGSASGYNPWIAEKLEFLLSYTAPRPTRPEDPAKPAGADPKTK